MVLFVKCKLYINLSVILKVVYYLNHTHLTRFMTEQEKPAILRLVGDNEVVPLTLVGVTELTLEKVLKHLQENEELFDYNVPYKWREPAKEGLQEFLIRNYLKGNFEITGVDEVKRYVQLYDFVEFYGDSPGFGFKFYLNPNMKGIIKKVDLDREEPLTILWDSSNIHPKGQELNHDGGDLSLLPDNIFRKEEIRNKIELLAEAAPGRLVKPTKISYEYSYYLPVGTKGIVTKVDKSEKFPVNVVFRKTEGYIPLESGIISIKYRALKLFRENRFDIRQIIRECS